MNTAPLPPTDPTAEHTASTPAPDADSDLAPLRAALERQLLHVAQLMAQCLEATLTGPLTADAKLSPAQVRAQHSRAIQAEGRLLVSLVRTAHSLRPRPVAGPRRRASGADESDGLQALKARLRAQAPLVAA